MKKDSSKLNLQKLEDNALTKNQIRKVKGGTESTNSYIVTSDIIIG